MIDPYLPAHRVRSSTFSQGPRFCSLSLRVSRERVTRNYDCLLSSRKRTANEHRPVTETGRQYAFTQTAGKLPSKSPAAAL